MDKLSISDCLAALSQDASELYLDTAIPVLSQVPNPLDFYRDWVSSNKPVVIQNAIANWPALSEWNYDYLREKIGDNEVTVAITPNGYADAVYQDRFVMPEERVMTFSSFLDILDGKVEANGVHYVQKQNSNFTDEFQTLMCDADCELSWASDAFGKTPDAVNFWMGDEKAITSTHKDHYENLYCVVSGHKVFTLLPPTDQCHIPYKKYQAATYKENSKGDFDIVDDLDTGQVPWIPVDVLDPDLDKYPEYAETHPVTVTVRAGETLYLPSLWYHHVQQSHGCIAVNFWYDMEYDIKYNYFTCIEKLMKLRSIPS